MTSVNNIRIAARIYDDIGDFQTADNLDNLIKLAAEKTFRPVDFLKALPLAVGIGTLGNVVKPLPTQPPIMEQKLMDEQDLYDQYDEDSQILENTFVKPKEKQIQKPVQRRLRPAPKLKFEPPTKIIRDPFSFLSKELFEFCISVLENNNNVIDTISG